MIATNAAHSWIQQKRIREVLQKLDFFVVQDMYATTESAQLAHLVLPAAAGVKRRAPLSTPSAASGSPARLAAPPGRRWQIFTSSASSPSTGAAPPSSAPGPLRRPCLSVCSR
nr:molybdopterin-dependent oxidoreductase [Verrucomicrobium spinosum]